MGIPETDAELVARMDAMFAKLDGVDLKGADVFANLDYLIQAAVAADFEAGCTNKDVDETRAKGEHVRGAIEHLALKLMESCKVGHWTATRPTEPGHYWVKVKRANMPVEDRRMVVFLLRSPLTGNLCIEDDQIDEGQVESYWSEPIAEPPT